MTRLISGGLSRKPLPPSGLLKAKRLFPRRRIILKSILFVAAGIALVCAVAPAVLAQHGGGHAGGGGHSSGGGSHMSAPHASAPAAPHFSAPPAPHFSAPPHMPGSPAVGAGTHFVAVPPPVHLVTPPAVNHPIAGNHVTITPPQTIITVQPHGVIGFPPPQTGGRFLATPTPGRTSGELSFSGQGHEIWRNPTAGTGAVTEPRADRDDRPRFPVRPIFPRWGVPPHSGGGFFGGPIFGPGFGFGGLGFGWGLGWGSNLWWGPSCSPYWGFGCNVFPYYDYGSGNYDSGYSPGNLEGQVESQGNGSGIYENAPAPLAYGGGERQLLQLYLKDGTVYDVADYWLVNDNELHFMTVDASGNQTEHVVGFDQLDLEKTIRVSKDMGYRFVLRNEPLQQYLQGTEQNNGQNNKQNTEQTMPGYPAASGPAQPPAPQAPAVPPQPNSPARAPQPQ